MPLLLLCPMADYPAFKSSSIFLVWTSHTPSYRTYNTTELCLHPRYELSHLSTAQSLPPQAFILPQSNVKKKEGLQKEAAIIPPL